MRVVASLTERTAVRESLAALLEELVAAARPAPGGTRFGGGPYGAYHAVMRTLLDGLGRAGP